MLYCLEISGFVSWTHCKHKFVDIAGIGGVLSEVSVPNQSDGTRRVSHWLSAFTACSKSYFDWINVTFWNHFALSVQSLTYINIWSRLNAWYCVTGFYGHLVYFSSADSAGSTYVHTIPDSSSPCRHAENWVIPAVYSYWTPIRHVTLHFRDR